MGIFSLNWFKSEKQKQLEELKLQEQGLKNAILRKKLEDFPLTTSEQTTIWKPFKKMKLVNNVLTVLMLDGSIISKTGATESDFQAVRACKTEDDVVRVMSIKEVKEQKEKVEREIKRVGAIKKGINSLKKVSDFVFDNDGKTVYLKGINRSIPQLLVEQFAVIVDDYINKGFLSFNEDLETALSEDEEYQSLKRFFMWCCLNPRAEVANELYRFLMENSFRITKQGFFVALRNVVTVKQDNEIVKFVSNAYNKVKAVWKKNPDNYRVMENDGVYSIEAVTNLHPRGTVVGNLTSLYLDLPNMAENRFTDDWTKTFDIRIGKVVSMPTEECNWSTQDCAAAGLHFTADQIHYVGCGDQSVLVLINPMKVVGIGQHKGRCYEYLPIMAVPREEATEILHDIDFDTLELDEDYAIRELEQLEEKAKEGFAKEAKKHSFNIPHLSSIEVSNIVTSLDEMKDEISKRVKNIVD
jgi:hypothetical protein